MQATNSASYARSGPIFFFFYIGRLLGRLAYLPLASLNSVSLAAAGGGGGA